MSRKEVFSRGKGDSLTVKPMMKCEFVSCEREEFCKVLVELIWELVEMGREDSEKESC